MTPYKAPELPALKVVFLDVDGVLVTLRTLVMHDPEFRHNKFDPKCVRALNRITDAAGAVIVLSSTWRIGPSWYWARLLTYFHKEGVKAPIVGRTPELHDKQRGDEIRAWIDENAPIRGFVVLDDDSDMDAVQKHHLKTSMQEGLTERHINHALDRLAREDDG
jgi:hypothetical protein